MKCDLICDNKTDLGYCKSTGYCPRYFTSNSIPLDPFSMTCANCKYNDGLVYTSIPPQYRCTITNNFHYGYEFCELTQNKDDKK